MGKDVDSMSVEELEAEVGVISKENIRKDIYNEKYYWNVNDSDLSVT